MHKQNKRSWASVAFDLFTMPEEIITQFFNGIKSHRTSLKIIRFYCLLQLLSGWITTGKQPPPHMETNRHGATSFQCTLNGKSTSCTHALHFFFFIRKISAAHNFANHPCHTATLMSFKMNDILSWQWHSVWPCWSTDERNVLEKDSNDDQPIHRIAR